MLNNDLSDALKTEVEKIIKKIDKESTVTNITMTFTSPKFPEYKVYLCREIQSLKIEQDYVANITDKITAELSMERDPYIGMLYMRKNMDCQLEITFFKPDEVADNTQYKRKPDISKKYKVSIIKFEDLFKKMSTEQLFPEKRRENDSDRKEFMMTVEMMEEDVYKARKQNLYFTGRDTTMYDMMRYCVNYFGYKKAYLAKPDNTKKYSNFVIPPAHYVEDIFHYLQNGEGFGIYKDGLISYITEGAWYVYPRYGEPVNKKPVNVYITGNNKYVGLNCNHCKGSGSDSQTDKVANAAKAVNWGETISAGAKVYAGTASASDYVTLGKNAKKAYDAYNEGDGGDPNAPTNIISQSNLNEINWTNVGSENEPTSIVAQMSELMVDASRTLVNDKICNLERRCHTPTVVPPDVMDYDNFVRIKHVKSHANLCKLDSDARTMQGRTLTFPWHHAVPWTFHPATIVTIYYDDKGKMEKHIGMCEKATYLYKKSEQSRILPLFTCEAEIEVYCSVREKGLVQSQR